MKRHVNPTASQSGDSISIHEFRDDFSHWIGRPGETGRPVILTNEGRAAAVLISPSMLEDISEQGAVTREVVAGLREVAAGDVVDDDEVWAAVDAVLDEAGVPAE